jgi:cysteine desulfurase
MENDAKHIEKLYNKIVKYVKEKITHVEINGDETLRYHGNLNISFAYVEG